MKTGIELIAEERREQVEKHGFDADHDLRPFNKHGALIQAAAYLLQNQFTGKGTDRIFATFPSRWSGIFQEKFDSKKGVEALKVAGALIAAEIDRIQNDMTKTAIVRIKFKDMPDLILAMDEYEQMGKWKGFLKTYCMSIRDVKSVSYELIDVKDYPKEEWQP